MHPMLFVPAMSLSEAEARLTAIAGGLVERTRGPKRVLRVFAEDLEVDVPTAATNGTLGAAIARKLGIGWPDSASTGSDQITLDGLNALLEGVQNYYSTHPAPVSRALPPQFAMPTWSWFSPARSKIEAVNRIAALTDSGPEELGPGGKERKSVLENLVRRGGLTVDTRLTKTTLGAALADALGVIWTPTCGSTGETITLEGLNVILAGAERHLRSRDAVPTADPVAEAKMLLNILRAEFGDNVWDGRVTVPEMRDDAYPKWRGNEWPGWYYEYRGLRALYSSAGARPSHSPAQVWANTEFDFAHGFLWDLKAHGVEKRDESGSVLERRSPGDSAPLNAIDATDAAVDAVGVGVLVLDGVSIYDSTGEFDAWHRAVVKRVGQRPYVSNSGFHRQRKAAFAPVSLAAYWFGSADSLTEGVRAGAMQRMNQGAQAPGVGETRGKPRKPKYRMNFARARPWLAHRIDLV